MLNSYEYLSNLLAATQIWFTINREGCLDCGKICVC